MKMRDVDPPKITSPSKTSQRLGEFYPGLWIGNLASIGDITAISPSASWSIISLLHSPQLVAASRRSVAKIRMEHRMDIRHIEWEIADQSQSMLLCPRLDDVLLEMDSVVALRRATDSGQDDGHLQAETAIPPCCLIHCAFGISRSTTICAIWLLSRRKCTTVAQAMDCIRRVRPEASPNLGFLATLRAIEQCDGDLTASKWRLNQTKEGI